MLKIISNKVTQLLFYLNVIPFILSEYEINQDGESCINAPRDPPYKEACTSYNSNETACCYATILFQNRSTVNKCIPVPKDARFALNHLTIFSFKDYDDLEYEDVTATFDCGQKDKFCGMDSPTKIFQCSEHSSTTQSCCFLSTPTYTECILSDEKYNKETTFKLFESSTVICRSKRIKIKKQYWVFYYIIVVYVLSLFT